MPKAPGSTMTDSFKVSAQWSRRMNSLKVYLTLRVHGREAYEDLIERQLGLAFSFADRIRRSDVFELAMDPVLPILNLRLKAIAENEIDTAQQAIVDEVTRSGERWISLTRVNGRSVIRAMVISYLTTQENIDGLWEALQVAARKCATNAAAIR
jgi:aromatic-L-amino-acid decarboxylase